MKEAHNKPTTIIHVTFSIELKRRRGLQKKFVKIFHNKINEL